MASIFGFVTFSRARIHFHCCIESSSGIELIHLYTVYIRTVRGKQDIFVIDNPVKAVYSRYSRIVGKHRQEEKRNRSYFLRPQSQFHCEIYNAYKAVCEL